MLRFKYLFNIFFISMPEFALDYHRLRTPIDHPDSSVTRGKLEYPTVDVSFTYLSAINKVKGCSFGVWGYMLLTYDSFSDKSVFAFLQVNDHALNIGRASDKNNMYWCKFSPSQATADHRLEKYVAGTTITLAYESIDIDNSGRGLQHSCSGSMLKSMRFELPLPVYPLSLQTPNATISATDTAFASGLWGLRFLRDASPHGGTESGSVFLLPPASALPPAQLILEVGVEGNGKDIPYAPSLSKNLVEISSLQGLPDFLYQESKRYQILRNKGFTDEEMKLLLGYVPQHQVDLDSVTWGAFEFHPDKASAVIITIIGDNPYSLGAIERQKANAKRVFKVPKDYDEAVNLYDQLKRDYPHWLAGKDNFAYQVLGFEVFDWLQNIDFYYGELIEYKTHYQQLKMVPDWEMRSRLNEIKDKLSRVNVLVDERDKHLGKLNEILKKGW
jgi:hypothetical protein